MKVRIMRMKMKLAVTLEVLEIIIPCECMRKRKKLPASGHDYPIVKRGNTLPVVFERLTGGWREWIWSTYALTVICSAMAFGQMIFNGIA